MTGPPSTDTFQHWGNCDECGFQGLIAFHTRSDEDYDDADALGFMLDSSCPACGHEESVLVVTEEYQEMVRLRKPPRGA